MRHPLDLSKMTTASRKCAEFLLTWKPHLLSQAFMDPRLDSEACDLVVPIESPTSDGARQIVVRMANEDLTVSFGSCTTRIEPCKEAEPYKSLTEFLDGITNDSIVLYRRANRSNSIWSLLYADKSRSIEEMLGRKFRWGSFEIQSWTGKSDQVIRLFSA